MISIIIPHRGSVMGLWATVHSCEIDLKRSGLEYEYIIVCNGAGETVPADLQNIHFHLKNTGKLGHWLYFNEPLSPPEARQRGSEVASGDILFFFDNHCLVDTGYFKRAVHDFNTYDMDLLHSTTKYYEGDNSHYQYHLTLVYNFWGASATLSKEDHYPYRIAVGGHGGFAVRAATWRELGGYGPAGLFVGYGGEELYVDLKFWMHGKSVWIDPRVVHYHFAGDRGYKRHYTDEFFVNMMLCARLIGGLPWMYKVYQSFAKPGTFMRFTSKTTMYELMMIAEERSRQHEQELVSTRSLTLDELFPYFVANDIPFKA